MKTEFIKHKIKESHSHAIMAGLYNCPECQGDGVVECCELACYGDNSCQCENKEPICNHCKGDKIDPNKNIGELIMLINCKVVDAFNAYRASKRSDLKRYFIGIKPPELTNEQSYMAYIKDTFEEKVADIFISLFDLCGYFDIIPENYGAFGNIDNVGEHLVIATVCLFEFHQEWLIGKTNEDLNGFFGSMLHLCRLHKVDIEKYIELRIDNMDN